MSELLAQSPALLLLVLFPLGLVVGSFLNVVAYRLPLMLQVEWRRDCRALLELPAEADGNTALNLATPNSHCPRCGAPVRPWHNIPVISYLWLRGRCASCGTSISPRYPIVELATAVLGCTLILPFGPSLQLAGALVFTWALIALILIDLDHQLLPDNITLPLLWLGLLLNATGFLVPLADAVWGAAAGYLILWSVYWLFRLLTGKEGMGYGDFKLLAAIGAWLGWQALPPVILISSVVGALLGGLLLLRSGRGRHTPVAFGPYLAMAGWVMLVWGDRLTAMLFGPAGMPP